MKLTILSCAVLLATTTWASAGNPDPAEISGPRPGQVVPLGEAPIELRPTPYSDATKYICTLTQASVVWSSGEQAYPICQVPVIDQKKFKPGDATVTVRVFYGKRWLPAATEVIQLSGSEEAAPDQATVDQVDPATVKPLTGGGKTFTLRRGDTTLKISIAIGADKWKVLSPNEVEDDHITFHHGNDERATAEIFVDRCDPDDPSTCLEIGISRTLKCDDPDSRKFVKLGNSRAASSCVWTKEMRDKRTSKINTVHWEAGGFVEMDPTSHVVVSCGLAASSPSHFAEVMRLCATMHLVK